MIPLNLKTGAGRCAPLALGQNAAIPEFTIPTDVHSGVAFSRPPLAARACCSGDDGTSVAVPYFPIEEGAGPQPVVPDPSWSVSTLNLSTNAGRCAPLGLPQPELPDITIPTGVHMSTLFSRPPLAERACCSGDDGTATAVPYFSTVTGDGPAPVAPDVDWSPGVLNLRTANGRRAPLGMPQPELGDVTEIAGAEITIAWTRPPLRDRSCCSGDDGETVATPYFTVTLSECMYIALEDELGLFALEDESGYFALECAV